jgi:FtsZ-binding cell division protein ZapB
MDSNLNVLEAKVLEAIGLIKELRRENATLTERCAELESRADELEQENGRLQQELESVRQEAADVEVYEAKRKEIEDKVGGLLEQLEALG